MADSLRILPAYGRKYETPVAALKDWEDGKDFKIYRGPYLSHKDQQHLAKQGYEPLVIWWNYPDHPIQLVEVPKKKYRGAYPYF